MMMCPSQVLLGLESSARARSRNQRLCADVFESSIVGGCKYKRYVRYISTDEQRTPKQSHMELRVEWGTMPRDFQIRMFRICVRFIVDCFILISFK